MDPVDDSSSNGELIKGKNEKSNKKIEISGEFNDSMFDSSDEEGQLDNDSSDLESLTKGRGKSKKIKNGGRLRKGKVEKQKGKMKGEGKNNKAKVKTTKEKKKEKQDDYSTDESDMDDNNENIDEELRDLQADIDDLSSIEENDEGGRRKRKKRTVGGVGTKAKKRKEVIDNDINEDNFIDNDDDDPEIRQEYENQQEFADEDDSYTDDPDDENQKSKTKKKNKIYKEKNATQTREETDIDRALKKATSSKKKNVKFTPEQIQEFSRRVVTEMRDAARLDKESYRNGKLAIAKISTLNKILPHLRNRNLHLRMLEEDHILDAIGEWIKPLDDNSLPSYNIRHELLKILTDLPCDDRHLTANRTDIGKIVKKLSEHPDETEDNKIILRKLIENWIRILTGRSKINYRRRMDRDPSGNKSHRQMNRNKEKESYAILEPGQGKSASDVYIPLTDNDLKIPMRAGFSYDVLPNMKHPSIRKKKPGAIAEDEAIEDPTRRQRGSGKGGNTNAEELRKVFKKR